MIPIRNKTFRALKLSILENFRALKLSKFECFRALKLSKFANLGCSNFRVRLSYNLESFRALKLSRFQSFRVRKYSFRILTFQGPKTLQSGEFKGPKTLQSCDGIYMLLLQFKILSCQHTSLIFLLLQLFLGKYLGLDTNRDIF